MRLKFFMLLSGLALLISVASLRANPAFILTPAARPGVGTNEVFFTGALTNTSLLNNLFLNNLQLDFTGTATNHFAADTNVFFANVPGILLPGETYADVMFGIFINPAAPPGTYSGTVTVQGGADIFAATSLTNQTFQISLPPAALSITPSGTNLVLSWPSPPGDFVLQQNFSLTTTNWTAVTNALALANFQNQVVLPLAATNQFYRLKYP